MLHRRTSGQHDRDSHHLELFTTDLHIRLGTTKHDFIFWHDRIHVLRTSINIAAFVRHLDDGNSPLPVLPHLRVEPNINHEQARASGAA